MDTKASSDDARAGTRWLLLPVVGIVAVAILVAVVQAWMAVREFDRHLVEERRHLAEAAMRQLRDDLRQDTLDYTWWDESVRRVVLDLDTAWAAHLWGYYQETYRDNQVVEALARDGAVIMVWDKGNARFGGAPVPFEPDIGPLVEAARRTSVNDPEPQIAWAWLDGDLYAVSVGAITPSDPIWASSYGADRTVGVFARSLTPQIETWIAADFLLQDLRAVPPDAAAQGETSIDLHGPDGVVVARLVWTPAEEGRHFMLVSALTTAVALLALVPLLFLFVRRALRVTADEAKLRGSLEREREVGVMKSRFVSMVSHEFRTPLTSIMASSQLLRHYSDRMSEADRQTELVAIEREVDRLSGMIDDIITLGQADAMGFKFRPEAVELGRLLREIADGAILAASSFSSIEIHGTDDLETVAADPNLLRLAVGNVMANAVKYSTGGEPVAVQVTCDGDLLQVVVVDRGIGIPDDEIRRLGRPFYRAANATRIGGTGLGLTIARSAVEGHGGSMAIESELGRGTRVTLAFRLADGRS